MYFSATGDLAVNRATSFEIFAIPGGNMVASYPIDYAQWYVGYSANGTLLAFGTLSNWPPGELVIQIIDRARGRQTVTLFDDPQRRPPDTGPKPRYPVALTFVGADRVAVAWNDGRLATFRASDGALLWSRVDSD
jgi:hypothetical protein